MESKVLWTKFEKDYKIFRWDRNGFPISYKDTVGSISHLSTWQGPRSDTNLPEFSKPFLATTEVLDIYEGPSVWYDNYEVSKLSFNPQKPYWHTGHPPPWISYPKLWFC